MNNFVRNSTRPALALAGTLLLALPTFGQQAAMDKKAAAPSLELVLGGSLALFLAGLLLVFLLMTFVQLLPLLLKFYQHPDRRHSAIARLLNLFRGDTQVLTGQARDVLMGEHAYDGIHEFDNDLPPWWKYLFYATTVFAGVYLVNYHVLSGPLQLAEYEAEMQQAALIRPAGGAGNANEKTDYKALTDAAQLEAGKAAYLQNCAACHGQQGEGMVGPNLTDEHWLHGGEVNEVFKTVKFGVTSKGMVAWQGKLSDDQILEVSSFILSLQGTNPANAKAPQGEKAAAK
jgi:cytochrome c oxidase cbb3-type subunit III